MTTVTGAPATVPKLPSRQVRCLLNALAARTTPDTLSESMNRTLEAVLNTPLPGAITEDGNRLRLTRDQRVDLDQELRALLPDDDARRKLFALIEAKDIHTADLYTWTFLAGLALGQHIASRQ